MVIDRDSRPARTWMRALVPALACAFVLVAATGVAQAFIYWGDYTNGRLGRVKLDGSAPNPTFITSLSHPSDIAVNANYIYWADDSGIGRANLDGSGVNETFIAANACAIAIDANYIYWSVAFSGSTIGRANLDGTSVNHNFITGAADPCGVAVNSTHIYWGNSGVSQTTVGRANLNGTSPNQSFITGGNRPYDIALNGTHVYWANRGNNTIGRATLAGASPNQAFITSTNDVFGLALNSSHIFWGNGGVGRANLDGTGITPQYIATNVTTAGVAIDAVETIRPVTTIDSGPAATTKDPNATFTFTSSRAGSTFECKLDAGSFGPCSSPASYGGLADGPHTFTVRATDTFGNVEEAPPSRTWTVDATAPDVSITAPANAALYTRGQAVTAAYACSDGGTGVQSCTGDVASGAAIDTATVGTRTFNVVAIDNVGNRRTASVAYTVVAPAGPTTPGVTPRITSEVLNEWLAYKSYTTVSRLSVSNVPAGATVTVRCSGRGCPLKVKKLTFAKPTATVNLKSLFNFTKKKGKRKRKIVSKLRVKTKVDIRITAPGTIGKFVVYTMRRRAIPSKTRGCLAPGTNAPLAC